MGRFIDLTGQRFGLLTVVQRLPPADGRTLWLTRCDCGNEKVAKTEKLRAGECRSCGCRERMSHGLYTAHRPEHQAWSDMKSRCSNPEHRSYADYGGRGITVCARWAESFEAFLADMGPRPSPEHSIDRIDNNRGYEPGNCRWAVPAVQMSNTRRNRYVEYLGERVTVSQLARRFGISKATLRMRLEQGEAVAAAVASLASRERGDRAGENNGRARLTEEQVAEIRRRAPSPTERGRNAAYERLGSEFGVTGAQIRKIALGQAWAAGARGVNGR